MSLLKITGKELLQESVKERWKKASPSDISGLSPDSATILPLKKLVHLLHPARVKWRPIGIQLDVDPSDLDDIQDRYASKPDGNGRCLEEVLRKSNPTLASVLTALKDETVDEEALACDIEKKCNNWQETGTVPFTFTSTVMAALADHLKAVYEREHVVRDCKDDPVPTTDYISLAIVKKEQVSQAEADEFTKETLHGGIDQIMNRKEAVKIEDILKPEPGQKDVKLVLVEGAPGVGKSTFALQICRRWDEIEALRKFSAVILLRLREQSVQEATTVAHLIHHSNHSIQEAVVEEITSSGGENVLLVLDGFDEVPTDMRKNFFVASLIRGWELPKATVVVTSRPSARADLLSLTKVDKHIEIVGFTSEQVEKYAASAFAREPGVLADFLKYIGANPVIKSMMYIPLNSAIVVDVYRCTKTADKPIPQTLTQLYTELTLTRLERYRKEEKQAWWSVPDRLEDLPQEVYCHFLSLAKLAYQGIVQQEVIFSELSSGCSHLGLITPSQELYTVSRKRGLLRYSFFHLTLQEFLAAFYISFVLRIDVRKRLFEQHATNKANGQMVSHMDVVWTFVVGLTGCKDIGQWVDAQLSRRWDNVDMSGLLVRYLYEAQDKAAIRSHLETGLKIRFSDIRCDAITCFSLGYCVAVSDCTWDIQLSSRVGAKEVEMLVHGLNSQEVVGTIEQLRVNRNPFGEEGMGYLRSLPEKVLKNISLLDLQSCRLGGAGLDLLSEIIPTMHSLEELLIHDNDVHMGGADKLLQTLAGANRLAVLAPNTGAQSPVPVQDIVSLSKLIACDRSVSSLCIGNEYADMVNVYYYTLSQARAVVCIQCSTDSIYTKTVLTVAEALKTNTTLCELDVCISCRNPANNELLIQCIEKVSELLKVNTTLKSLRVRVGHPCDPTAMPLYSILEVLKSNCTLKELLLPMCYYECICGKYGQVDSRVRFLW